MDPIEALARRHRRVVLTSDLLGAGVSEAEIARARRDGRLVRLMRGVYAVAPLTEPVPLLMAVAAARRYPTGAVACEYALVVHGCPLDVPDDVHVLAPRPRPDGTEGVVIHGSAWPVPLMHVGGIRVVTGPMAVIGAWSDLRSLGDRRAVVCAALGTGIARTPEVAALNPSGRRVPGAVELLRTCAYVDLGCESPLEIDYYVGIEIAFRLPPPTGRQLWLDLPDGRRRRVDVRYDAARLIVEIDGAHHRLDEATRRRDEADDALLAAMGWRVLRFTGQDIRLRPSWVAAQVLSALLATA